MDTVIPQTITVVGEGSATAPAEEAHIIIVIGGDSNVYVDPAAIGPDTAPTPTAIDATGIVDAIVASGIPAEDVGMLDPQFQGEWGPGMPPTPVTISVTLTKPTVSAVNDLLTLVRSAAAENSLWVNQFSVMYSVADCRPLHQQARVAAVANAREKAEDQATALETTAEIIVASRDTMPVSMGYVQLNTCTSTSMAMPLSMKYVAAPFDPAQPAEVTVTVAVEVSFELP